MPRVWRSAARRSAISNSGTSGNPSTAGALPPEEVRLADLEVAGIALGGLHGPAEHLRHRPASGAEAVERARVDEGFRAPGGSPGGGPPRRQKSKRSANGPAAPPGPLDDALRRASPHPPGSRRARSGSDSAPSATKAHSLAFTSGGRTAIPRSRQSSTRSTTRSVLSISAVSAEAMNGAGWWRLSHAVW